MKFSGFLKFVKEVITAYGGWSVGKYIVSRNTDDESKISTGAWTGMAVAEIISFAADALQSKEKSSSEQEIEYRTDHVKRLKSKQANKSNSIQILKD